jgi:hypothetical protein
MQVMKKTMIVLLVGLMLGLQGCKGEVKKSGVPPPPGENSGFQGQIAFVVVGTQLQIELWDSIGFDGFIEGFVRNGEIVSIPNGQVLSWFVLNGNITTGNVSTPDHITWLNLGSWDRGDGDIARWTFVEGQIDPGALTSGHIRITVPDASQCTSTVVIVKS